MQPAKEETMTRRGIFGALATTALGLVVTINGAAAQQKSFKELIVGTWTLLISDNVRADGTRVPGFGPNASGTVMFGPDGHYSLQIMRDSRLKFASNDRSTGTPDENRSAMQGTITHFGTYAIDEAQKTLTFRIESSSYPNWDGTTQKRPITALASDALTWTNPTPSVGPSGFVKSELAWIRAK